MINVMNLYMVKTDINLPKPRFLRQHCHFCVRLSHARSRDYPMEPVVHVPRFPLLYVKKNWSDLTFFFFFFLQIHLFY